MPKNVKGFRDYTHKLLALGPHAPVPVNPWTEILCFAAAGEGPTEGFFED